MSLESVHKYIQEKKANILSKELSASPQLVLKSDGDGRSPLMWALSESQDKEIVSIVLKAARDITDFDINAADEAGYTALHIAASLGTEMVELVLEMDPIIDSRTNNAQTPLFFAVSKTHIDSAKLLIEHNASVKAKDKRQITILQRAVGVGSVELVELLLERGAPVNATDIHGWTALHYAYAEARSDVIKLLLRHGADESIESRDGELPAQAAPKGYKLQ